VKGDSEMEYYRRKIDIQTVAITAKCSDMCQLRFFDQNKDVMINYCGYVPSFLSPDEDLIGFEIDIKTGQIINWKTPSQADINAIIDQTD